jgi:probable HAF family extracellular repeat protein
MVWQHRRAIAERCDRAVVPHRRMQCDTSLAINAHGQVVGVSFGGASGSRAFIWQNGGLTNLNDLVDIAPDVLVSAQDINDVGQITGRVRDGVTGEVLAIVPTPVVN